MLWMLFWAPKTNAVTDHADGKENIYNFTLKFLLVYLNLSLPSDFFQLICKFISSRIIEVAPSS